VTDQMTATLPNRGAQLKILSDYRYRMKKKMFPQRENIVKKTVFLMRPVLVILLFK